MGRRDAFEAMDQGEIMRQVYNLWLRSLSPEDLATTATDLTRRLHKLAGVEYLEPECRGVGGITPEHGGCRCLRCLVRGAEAKTAE